jgi:hypothetical protein
MKDVPTPDVVTPLLFCDPRCQGARELTPRHKVSHPENIETNNTRRHFLRFFQRVIADFGTLFVQVYSFVWLPQYQLSGYLVRGDDSFNNQGCVNSLSPLFRIL